MQSLIYKDRQKAIHQIKQLTWKILVYIEMIIYNDNMNKVKMNTLKMIIIIYIYSI